MTGSKRAIELIKTFLIILLTLSALLLAWQTRLFNEVFAAIPLYGNLVELVRGSAGGVTEQGGASLKEAARPLSIVITNEEGGRFGLKYDTEARNAVYERTSIIIGEALGSASAPSEISEDEWRSALSGHGVYYEYITPIRLSVLDGWLGAKMPETTQDILLRRIFIAFGEERSRLYYQDHGSGLFFGMDTASAAAKAQELEIYSANGAEFAFETGVAGSENAPYMLIMPGSDHPEVRVTAVGSAEELLEKALYAFGHLGETYHTYDGDSDTLICVGIQFHIRVSSDGRVQYRRTDGLPAEGEAPVLSESEMTEQARAIASDSIGVSSGSAEVVFEEFRRGEDSYTVFFSYYIAGGRVHLSEDMHGASVTFSSGVVTAIEVNFRNITFTGELTRLLPERQALAATSGEFMLCYSDTGSENLHPFWVRYGF